MMIFYHFCRGEGVPKTSIALDHGIFQLAYPFFGVAQEGIWLKIDSQGIPLGVMKRAGQQVAFSITGGRG